MTDPRTPSVAPLNRILLREAGEHLGALAEQARERWLVNRQPRRDDRMSFDLSQKLARLSREVLEIAKAKSVSALVERLEECVNDSEATTMNAVYANVLLRDVLAYFKREAASRLSSPDLPVDLMDALHDVFTRHGIASRTQTPLVNDVIQWAAQAMRQSRLSTPEGTRGEQELRDALTARFGVTWERASDEGFSEEVIAQIVRCVMPVVSAPSIAFHKGDILAHVSASLKLLERMMAEHDAISKCGQSVGCLYCRLLAISFAQMRRVLDFLEVEIPKR